MLNAVVKNFTKDGSWTCPAGLSSVKVLARRRRRAIVDVTRNLNNACPPMVIDPNAIAWTWGQQAQGQAGVVTQTVTSSPTAVTSQNLRFSRAFMTGATTYWLTPDSLAYSAGDGTSGALADATVLAKSSPVAIGFNALIQPNGQSLNRWIKEIIPGRQTNAIFAMTMNGQLWAWGDNSSGCLGDGTLVNKSSAVAVFGGIIWQKILPAETCLGLDVNGGVWAWGSGSSFAQGTGTASTKSSPVAVLGGLVAKDIGSGYDVVSSITGFLVTTAGAVFAWGANGSGQAGQGNINVQSSPVAVLGGLIAEEIICTRGAANFIRQSDGTLYAFGLNNKGCLGVGDSTPRSSPVAVLGTTKFARVFSAWNTSTSNLSMYGLDYSGNLWAWGANEKGQLGVGDTVARSSPVAVLGSILFTDINTGYNFSDTSTYVMGVDRNGRVWGWGGNGSCQIGDGTVVSKSSPVAVIGAVLADSMDQIYEVTIPVTPGVTYPIVISSRYNGSFGNRTIGQGIDELTLLYGQ